MKKIHGTKAKDTKKIKEKLLMTFKKGQQTLWGIVNTVRGKKKHDTIDENLYDINETNRTMD